MLVELSEDEELDRPSSNLVEISPDEPLDQPKEVPRGIIDRAADFATKLLFPSVPEDQRLAIAEHTGVPLEAVPTEVPGNTMQMLGMLGDAQRFGPAAGPIIKSVKGAKTVIPESLSPGKILPTEGPPPAFDPTTPTPTLFKKGGSVATGGKVIGETPQPKPMFGPAGKPLPSPDQAFVEEALRTPAHLQTAEQRIAIQKARSGVVPGSGLTKKAPPPSVEPSRFPLPEEQIAKLKQAKEAIPKPSTEMTPDELRSALLTSEKAGIPNARAYQEAVKKPVHVMSDFDGLKYLNDNYGYEMGDKMIAAKGQALKELGIEGYHLQGDEFMTQFNTAEEAETALSLLKQKLKGVKITAELPDGRTVTKEGIDFSYGIGSDKNSAEEFLKKAKQSRKGRGLRADRGGNPGGVVESPPQGNKAPGYQPPESVKPPDEPPPQPQPVVTPKSPKQPSASSEVEMFTIGAPPSKLSKAIKGFFRQESTMTEGKEFLQARAKAQGFLQRSEEVIEKVTDPMKKWDTPTKQTVFKYLDGQIPLDQVPAAVQETARETRRLLDHTGKMLVRRGLLSAETYEAHKGSYIRYLYTKHLVPDDAFKAAGGPAGRLNLSYLKKRQDLSPDVRKALGLIEDPHVAAKVGLSQQMKDIGMYDFMKRISDNPNWVHPDSFVEVQGIAGRKPIRMSLGALKDEVETYRKMAKTPFATPDVEVRLSQLEDSFSKAQKALGEVPENFVQLPDTKAYGPLRGAFVDKVIAQDLKPLFTLSEAEGSKLVETIKKVNAAGVTAFKVGKVPLNIPTGARNFVSGMLQNAMGGMPIHSIPKYTISAIKEIKAGGKDFTRAKRLGLFKGSFTVGEIDEVLAEFTQAGEGAFPGMIRAAANLAKKAAKPYGLIDNVNKLAMFKYQIAKGLTEADAAAEAAKWGMDYSFVHPSVRFLRKTVMPFATYPYKALPLIAESLKTRPWVIAGGLALPYTIAEGVKEYNDLTDEDWEKLQKQLPLFIRRSHSYTILPWKDEKGNWGWVDLQYFMPWGNLIQTADDIKSGDVAGTLSDTGIGANPWLQLFMAAKSGMGEEAPKDPFTGQPLYNPLDPPREKLMKTLNFVYNQWAPSMLTEHGAAGKTVKAVTGQADRYGRTPTKGEAAARWFGVNIVHPTPEQANKEKAFLIGEAQQNLNRILKDPRNGPEKKREAKRVFQKKVREIRGQE